MNNRHLFDIPEQEIFDLVEELDVRGPRYTSYPTAPVWDSKFPTEPYINALHRAGSSGRPLAAYLHLPFCKSRCLYCGCNSFIVNKEDTIRGYVQRLEQEIITTGAELGENARHAWLHLGGGTPTHVPVDALARVLDIFLDKIPGVANPERSVEVDPRVTTDEHLRVLGDRGFRRISVGLQDFEPDVQKAIRREYSVDQMKQFIERSRKFGFTSVNVDLIYGLPYQTRDTWRRTLELVGDLQPERLATFGYAHLPAKIKHQRALPEDELPSANDRLGMLLDANRFFSDQDYAIIGLDHFAKRGDSLATAVEQGTLWRNFMGYTDIRGVEMVGFGASSIGELDEMFVQNTTLPQVYNDRIDKDGWAVARGHMLDTDDRIRKTLINDLMCNLVVRIPKEADDVPGLSSELEAALDSLKPYEEHGLIVPRVQGGYEVTSLGRLFLRNLAMPFDRYLPEQANVTFSKTV